MDYILYFFIFSFAGWVLETAYASFEAKRFVSKQTLLKSPMCPIYGAGAVAMIIALLPVSQSVVLVFCGGFFVASSVEYLVGAFYEYKFGVMWWDYRGKRANLGGKVAADMSVLWGIIAIFFFKFMFPAAERLVSSLDNYEKLLISVVLVSYFISDYKNTLKDLKKYINGEPSFAESRFAALKKIGA